MSGLGTCRDCGEWIYWQTYEGDDGKQKHVPFDEPGFFTLHWATCTEQDYVVGFDGGTYRVQQCRDCREPVYWPDTLTRNGKKRPFDCFMDGDNWVEDYGTCHFDTCREKVGVTNNWRAQDRHRARTSAPPPRPEPEQPALYYRLKLWLPDLGLSWPCCKADVMSAFRKKALETHPDMGGSAAAFIRVKRAYDALKDLVPA